MELLSELINSICPVPEELAEKIESSIIEKIYKKNEYFLKEGEVCRYIWFIKKGLTRCYYTKGISEVCSWFMKEGDMIISVDSFFQQKPGLESIEALEDCEVSCLKYDDLQFLYKNFSEMNFIGRVLTEKYYILSEQRLYSLRMHRSQQRYDYLMKNFPELVQRIPVKYLASYIGVSRETLSRSRRKRN